MPTATPGQEHRFRAAGRCLLLSVKRSSAGQARYPPLVISSPHLGVFAVAAAGVLCAFPCVVDALPGHCLRRRSGTNPLFAAVFRIKRLLREHCSATCQRRRRPGQARRRQRRLQITAVLDAKDGSAAERHWRPGRAFLGACYSWVFPVARRVAACRIRPPASVLVMRSTRAGCPGSDAAVRLATSGRLGCRRRPGGGSMWGGEPA